MLFTSCNLTSCNLTSCDKNVLIAVIAVATRIIEPSTHWTLTFSKPAMETSKQGVNSVQSLHKRHQKDIKCCRSGIFIVNSVHFTCKFYWVWTGKYANIPAEQNLSKEMF